MKNRRLILLLAAVPSLLLIPYIAMQLTNEVHWTTLDFVVMGVLLMGVGLLCEWVLRKVAKKQSRIALCAVIVSVFIIIWLELAVGIIGTPFAGS